MTRLPAPSPATTKDTNTMTTETEHRPLVLLVGAQECLDRDCEDYVTDDGEPDPGVERCSHIREETVCVGCSAAPNADGEYERTVPWAGPHTA